MVFDSGFVPDEWLLEIVKPNSKTQADPNSPENYCPIILRVV